MSNRSSNRAAVPEAKITSSPEFGIYMIFKKSEKITLPDTYANMAKVTPIIAEVPVAKPSIPSVIFAPLETGARKVCRTVVPNC